MTDDTKLIQYIEVILVHLGYDTDSPLFKDTAVRFANSMRPFFANETVPVGSILGAAAEELNDDIPRSAVTLAPMEFTAMCARHFMPIFGSVGILYIADTKVPTFRTISHMVEYHTRQFIDQELSTRAIAEEIKEGINPLALYVVVSARHTCEGNAIITTEMGGGLQVLVSQSLVERVEKSVR